MLKTESGVGNLKKSQLLTFCSWSFEFVTTFGVSDLSSKMPAAFLRNAGAGWLLFFDIWRKNSGFRSQKAGGERHENALKT
jgi:hypothetical protein